MKKVLILAACFLFFSNAFAATHNITSSGTQVRVSQNDTQILKNVVLKVYPLASPQNIFALSGTLPFKSNTLSFPNIFIPQSYRILEEKDALEAHNIQEKNYPNTKHCMFGEVSFSTLPASNVSKTANPNYFAKKQLNCTANVKIECANPPNGIQADFYFTRGGLDAVNRTFGGSMGISAQPRQMYMNFSFNEPDTLYCYVPKIQVWNQGKLGDPQYGQEACCVAESAPQMACNNNGICESLFGETQANCPDCKIDNILPPPPPSLQKFYACNASLGKCEFFGEFENLALCASQAQKHPEYSRGKCFENTPQGNIDCLNACDKSIPPTSDPIPPAPLHASSQYFYCLNSQDPAQCQPTSQLYAKQEDCEINLAKYLSGKTTGKCYKAEDENTCKKECVNTIQEFYACDWLTEACVKQGLFTSAEKCKKMTGKECYGKEREEDCKKECVKNSYYFCDKKENSCVLTFEKYSNKGDCEKALKNYANNLNTGICYQNTENFKKECLKDCQSLDKKVTISNLKCFVMSSNQTPGACVIRKTYDIKLSADLKIEGYNAVNFWFFDEKNKIYGIGLQKYQNSGNLLNVSADIKNVTSEYCFNARTQAFDENGKLTDRFTTSPEKVCCNLEGGNQYIDVDDDKKIAVNGKNYELIVAKINNPEKVLLDLGFANDTVYSTPISRTSIINRVKPIYAMSGTFYHIARGGNFQEMLHSDPLRYWMPWRPLSNYIKNGVPHIIFNCGTSICQKYDGSFEIGRLRFNLVLANPQKNIPAINIEDNVNSEISKNGAALYTDQWWDENVGTEVSRKYDLLSIVFDDDLKVVSVGNGAQKTPKNGYVLLLSGNNKNKYQNLIIKGDKFDFIWRALPQNDVNLENWKKNCRVIFGGLHTSIYNGRLLGRNEFGNFDGCIESEAFSYKTSRSVIGMDKEGKVNLIIVKGAVDIMEVGPIIQKLGIVKAFNIDGGCSTVAWYNNKWLGGRDLQSRWTDCLNPDNLYQACRTIVPVITYIKLK